MKNTLHTSEVLRVGDYLTSPLGTCFLIVQSDGNLCIYAGAGPKPQGGALWSALTKSEPEGAYYAVMQGDGNLVVYQGAPGGPSRFVWGTMTVAPGGRFVATLENAGFFTVSTAVPDSRALWASKTVRLLTYNVHIMEGSNIVVGAAWDRAQPVLFRDEERYQYILRKIKGSKADIVAFQEMWSEKNMERLMADLKPEYMHNQRGNSGSLTKAGCGLVLASKYPFSDGSFYQFPGGEGSEGWATKGVVRTTIHLSPTVKLAVGISHCWTDAGGGDCANIRDIINHTGQENFPGVMMGDFNIHRRGDTAKFGKMDQMMRERRATDSWSTVHGKTWTDAAATDDQVNNTLAQFFSPDRNTPDPDCLDYIYLRDTQDVKLRPISARVVTDWHYPTGGSNPPWYWVHAGTSANLPTGVTFGDTLCLVTRSMDVKNGLQVALYEGKTKRWTHYIIRDAKGAVVEAHGSPGMCWFDNRLHLFYQHGKQVYKMESQNGRDWTPPNNQGANFQSSGGVSAVFFRNTIYVFVCDPGASDQGGGIFYHVWNKRWEDRRWVGITTFNDMSAAAVGDVLCVVTKDNTKGFNKTSGVMRAVLDGRNQWDLAQVGNSITCGTPGVTVRNKQFEVFFREANCGGIIPQYAGCVHMRSSGDGRNWSGEQRLATWVADAVCPVAYGDKTLLFFPYFVDPEARLIYKTRALAHSVYPEGVELDASDHYPYEVEMAWPA